jgi:hypothetical protein
MSYTFKLSPLEFNLNATKSGTSPLDFNLGNDAGDATGEFDFKLDEVTGSFEALSLDVFGAFAFQLDDCVGVFEGEYDSNVRRSLYNGANIVVEQTVLLQSKVAFLQANAVKNSISALSMQGVTIAESSMVAMRQGNGLVIETQKTSQQNIAINIGANTDFRFQQAVPTFFELNAKQNVAIALLVKTAADLQQLIPIGQRYSFVVDDMNDATHVFKVHFNKTLLPEFQYTPRADFILQQPPIERIFTQTDPSYQTKNPVEFDLLELANKTNVVSFDLNDSGLEKAQFTRSIFESVLDYAPSGLFSYAFTGEKYQLLESVQRGGFRLSKSVNTATADTLMVHKCFKSEQALVLFNVKQRLADTGGGGTGNTDPPRPSITPKPTTITFTIPRKTVYTMQHTITATLLDLTPLDVSDISLNVDADSWAWTFNCRLLNAEQLPLVVKSDGTAVQIIITINGYSFNVLVEKVTRNRTFAKNSISLSGRSLTALLTLPYLQPTSATQSDLMNVQQLVALELPFGWEIGLWSAANWSIPAGAFSYTAKTPIQVISGIAADIGAVIAPSRHSKKIDVMPRYPVLPWNYENETPDLIIPDAVIESLTYRNVVPAQGNAVYVHGSDIGGVLSRCRLTGTAGDKLLQTITNSLMTDVIGCRALGERLLAAQWEQPAIQSLMIPLNATDIPLAKIGDLVRIDIDDGHVFGVVNSVGISANLGKVSQTITIGEETANVWQGFKELLPRDPLLVGTLSNTDGQTSLMTLIDGGVIRVRGTGTVNSKYYIRAGRIENEAPNLVVSELVI